MMGKRLNKLKILKIQNKNPIIRKGTIKLGRYTLSNNIIEFKIIPTPKLNPREGIITYNASKNKIFFIDFALEPIDRMIKKSFTLSIIPPF